MTGNEVPSSKHGFSLEALVERAIGESQAEKVWVAFSGGVDSTALLLAAVQVWHLSEKSFELEAIHVDHGLQQDAPAWVAHAQAISRALDVNIRIRQATVQSHGNLEHNARRARYQAFADCLGPRDVLLLGHHLDDQVETILYRCFQGRGLIPMRGHGMAFGVRFARPWLSVRRTRLERYVAQHGVAHIEDPSNADTQLDRNFLRQKALPMLLEQWPQLDHAVLRLASQSQAIQRALSHSLQHLGDKVPLAQLPKEPLVLVAWLRTYLETKAVYSASDSALTAFAEQLHNKPYEKCLLKGCALYGYDHQLFFERSVSAPVLEGLLLRIGDAPITLPHGQLSLEVSDAQAPFAMRYTDGYQVAFRRGGEVIDIDRGNRTVKNLLSEHRVPPWQRASYPLLESAGRLVCIPEIAVARDENQANSAPNEVWVVAKWTPT